MARTAVHVTTFLGDATVASPAGTALDATNHHSIDPGGPVEEILIRITNTTNAAKTVTAKAGANPPALEAGVGDLASVSLADGSTTPTVGYMRLTSGRFVQADGTIWINVASGMTGTIEAFKIPGSA